MVVDLIGFVSTACICAMLVPQIVKIMRTRDVSGLSFASYVVYTVGNGAGLIYGLDIHSAPVTVTSAITLGSSTLVLILRGMQQKLRSSTESQVSRVDATVTRGQR